MRRTYTRRQWLLMGLAVLIVCFIWGNSLLPARISAAFSLRVSRFLAALLRRPLDTSAGHGLVRKLAHGTEYLALGVTLTALLRVSLKRPWSQTAFLGIAAALIDETIQLFSAGRSGQIQDVWIDMGGFAAGVLLCRLISEIREKRRRL